MRSAIHDASARQDPGGSSDNTEFIAESGTDGLHDSPLEEAVTSELVSGRRQIPC